MKAQIIETPVRLHDWFQTPSGRYLLEWEQDQFDQAVADLFGYHALQLGLDDLDTLRNNRMPHRWLALESPRCGLPADEAERGPGLDLLCDHAALPFPEHSLDLVSLPHALELNLDPHSTLREVERVLVPEGRVVISGLNPASLWGLRQQRAHLCRRLGFGSLYLPDAGEFIAYWRLRDWLRLLGFEVEVVRFGCYRAAVRSERWLQRLAWMDRAGARWWPILGAAYFVVACKRVRGMRPLANPWKAAPVVQPASVSVANYHLSATGKERKDDESR
jgi:SAM-dependent methyltransferase